MLRDIEAQSMINRITDLNKSEKWGKQLEKKVLSE